MNERSRAHRRRAGLTPCVVKGHHGHHAPGVDLFDARHLVDASVKAIYGVGKVLLKQALQRDRVAWVKVLGNADLQHALGHPLLIVALLYAAVKEKLLQRKAWCAQRVGKKDEQLGCVVLREQLALRPKARRKDSVAQLVHDRAGYQHARAQDIDAARERHLQSTRRRWRRDRRRQEMVKHIERAKHGKHHRVEVTTVAQRAASMPGAA